MSKKELEAIVYGREQREFIKRMLLEAIRELHIYKFLGSTQKALLIDQVTLFSLGTDFPFEAKKTDKAVLVRFQWDTGIRGYGDFPLKVINVIVSIKIEKLRKLGF